MKLKDTLEKFQRDRKHKFFVLSGEKGLGKTEAALERAVFLQDNYCIRDNENILVISDEDVSSLLEKVKSVGNRENTFFSFLNNNSIEIFSKKKFFHHCFKETNDKGRPCNDDIAKGILLEGINILRHENKRLDKVIIPQHIDFLLDEIFYIKALGIDSLEVYQNFDRKNRRRPLRKNSKARQAVFTLFSWYVGYMKEIGVIDSIDEFNKISNFKNLSKKINYAHIIIIGCEILTVEEIKFLRSLLKDVDYGNFVLVKNTKIKIDKPWINYFKRNKDICFIKDEKYKVVNCKKDKILDNKKVEDKDMVTTKPEKEKSSNKNFIDNYKYVDFKHNVSHDFAIDTSSYDEVILNPDTTSEVIGIKEISKIPVYNEIAAGAPISINDEIEGEFNIPIYWLKGVQQPFILKIKGDSMININIEDGDYVVINKQTMANNNDIVAASIDGEATLKRLWLKGGKAVLMPENDKYYPIEIKEDNAYIIGKAVGLIKSIN